MTAIRQQIFGEIENRLKGIGGVQEVAVMPPGDPSSWPAIHVFDGGQRPGDNDTIESRYELSATIEGYLERAGGTGIHQALNDLYASVVDVLMTEPPLGGLAETIDEGELRVVVADLASSRRLAFSLDFTITFPTARGHPAQPA